MPDCLEDRTTVILSHLFDRGASVESLKHPSEQSIDFENLTLGEGEMGLRRIVYHSDEVSASHIARDIKRWLAEAEGME